MKNRSSSRIEFNDKPPIEEPPNRPKMLPVFRQHRFNAGVDFADLID
jgi:hypothetical protein